MQSVSSKLESKGKLDEFSAQYDLDYRESILKLAFQFRFCPFCLSEDQEHLSSCGRRQFTTSRPCKSDADSLLVV